MATEYPVGLCILGSRCHNPTGQLRPAHRCPACEEICHPVTCSFLKEHYVTKKGEKLDDVYLCADCTAGRSHVPLDATEATPTQDNETPQEEEARKRKANEMSQPSPPPNPAPDTPNTPRTRNSTRTRANEQPKVSTTKKPKSVRFRPGLRVKIQRQHLYHVINNEFQRRAIPRSHGNTYQYYGTIVKRGTGRKGTTRWIVSLDVFPDGHKEIQLYRSRLKEVSHGEEEREYERDPGPSEFVDSDDNELDSIRRQMYDVPMVDEDPNEITDNAARAQPADDGKKKKKKATRSEMEFTRFLGKSDDDIKAQKKFDWYYGSHESQYVRWEFLDDDKHIVDDPLEELNPAFKKELDWDLSLDEIFFEEFFPKIKGHAELVDEYNSDERAPWYQTVKSMNIKFHDPDADDPDWKVKQCYLLLIAACTEVEIGVMNLWKNGPSEGRRDYPDFGQYMPREYFNAWKSAAAFAWCDKSHWYKPATDMPWDVFQPCLDSFNSKRHALLNAWSIILDESMSGWRPKTTKFGGLPNYTYEPRKPVPLGTMFKNSAECATKCMVFQDVVKAAEVQSAKKYCDELSHTPGDNDILQSVAEVLRQVEGAGIPPGGWCGGDAWFGSVMAAVEVKVRKSVDSTFIIKNNRSLFPMQALYAMLKARHTKPIGHWVVATSEIHGVKLVAIAYAWSARGVSYFVTTAGNTAPAEALYKSYFEDDWGNVGFKELQRPEICDYLYERLPIIDELNKQRQSYLAIEKSWPTKCCWFRLLTTMIGMSVVDMHSCFEYQNNGRTGRQANLQVRQFSDRICKGLKKRDVRVTRRVTARGRSDGGDNHAVMERITNDQNELYRPLTTKQKSEGKRTGTAINQKCFVCRKYLMSDGKTLYKDTIWRCSICKMPVCKQDRRMSGRSFTCWEEHHHAKDIGDEILKCEQEERGGRIVFVRTMPDDKKVHINRRSHRQRPEVDEARNVTGV